MGIKKKRKRILNKMTLSNMELNSIDDAQYHLYKNSSNFNQKRESQGKIFFKEKNEDEEKITVDKQLLKLRNNKKDFEQEYFLENLYIIDLLYKKKRFEVNQDIFERISPNMIDWKKDIKINKDKKGHYNKRMEQDRLRQINTNQSLLNQNDLNKIYYYIETNEDVREKCLNYVFEMVESNNEKSYKHRNLNNNKKKSKYRAKRNLYYELN